ncbi:MAG: ATP-binding protein [Acidimicrobiales bacterium]
MAATLSGGAAVLVQELQVLLENNRRDAALPWATDIEDGGSGLGLAIVHDIVTRHSGTTSFTDAPSGARVVVELPAPTRPEAHRTPEPVGAGATGGLL